MKDIVSAIIYGTSRDEYIGRPLEFGSPSNLWTWGVILLAILTLLSWVRNIANFSFTFLFANVMMFTVVICILVYSISHIWSEGLGDNLVMINTNNMWSTVGFAIYTYEGIGILMPVMQACECPEKFDKILSAAIITLTIAYITFGTICYFAFGQA